jgi:hypothetical protein
MASRLERLRKDTVKATVSVGLAGMTLLGALTLSSGPLLRVAASPHVQPVPVSAAALPPFGGGRQNPAGDGCNTEFDGARTLVGCRVNGGVGPAVQP